MKLTMPGPRTAPSKPTQNKPDQFFQREIFLDPKFRRVQRVFVAAIRSAVWRYLGDELRQLLSGLTGMCAEISPETGAKVSQAFPTLTMR
jgi:hypothetical protein